jgi:serine/threonine protein kinase/WD40 repeat protein/tetratricopeptide (TPR) repeat protein
MADTSDSRDVLLVQLADEFAARHRAGERPELEDYCSRHPDLATDIRSLFPAMAELEQANADAGQVGAATQVEAPPVSRLGDFHLLREVGRGGMGVVYEAEQISLGRRVALKLLPTNLFRDPVKRRRFEREAKSAAKLHHTNIVPVHGFGEHDGTPYYVMQFIPGLGLDAVIEELGHLPGRASGSSRPPTDGPNELSVALARSLIGVDEAVDVGGKRMANEAPTLTSAGSATPDPGPLSRPTRGSSVSISSSGVHLPGQSGSDVRGTVTKKTTYWESVARIGVQVAGALAYAHKLGVQHRDIKPANLLLDLDGIVWVTDFGLAKADDSDNLTNTGDLLGTLRYMPPEAFEGKSDSRSDIYALGLTLFELIALRPAYEEHDRNRLVKQVTTGDPPRLRKLRKDAPRDLVTIVEKAIDRDPTRRYQSAGALADDLQRFMDGRPITARRATELERLWMWARRRPAMAGLVAALFLCLLAGSLVSTVLAVRAAGFARDAELREKDATVARDTARRNADEAKEARNAAALQSAALLLDRGIEDARGGEPGRALHLFVKALRTLPTGDPQAAPLHRVIRANFTAWAETVPALEHILASGPRYMDIAFTPNGELIALAVGKDMIQCLRTDTGRPVGEPIQIPGGVGGPMVFAPDAESLWIASPGRLASDATKWAVQQFDPKTGRPLQPAVPTTGPVERLVITPDGRHLVGAILAEVGRQADAERTIDWRTAEIIVWNTADLGKARRVPVNADRERLSLAVSPDGKSVTVWMPHASQFKGLTFGVVGNEPPKSLGRHPLDAAPTMAGLVNSSTLHFENNARSALAIKDDQVHRWSATNPGVLGPGIPTPFRYLHDGPAADGRSAISPTEGRVFDTGAWPPRPSGVRFAHPGWQRNVNAFADQSPDGRFMATWVWQAEGEGRLWRLPRLHSRPPLPASESARLPDHKDYFQAGLIGPLGASAILWSPLRLDNVHDVRVVDTATGAVRGTSVRHSANVRQAVISPDGRYFATASFDGTARVWDTASGRPAGPPLQHVNYVASVAFSPDGKTLAVGDYGIRHDHGFSGFVKLWNWRTGKEVGGLEHNDIILSVTFSPDGRYLAVIKSNDWSKKPEILVWEVESGKAVFRLPHAGPNYQLRELARFRPDGAALTTRDINGVLHLWENPSGNLLGKRLLDGDGQTRFSPDGRVVAAAATLGVRLLDGNTLDPLPGGFLPHPDHILDVAFSPDGAFLLTGHETGSAQLWDVATRKPVGPPAVLIGPIRTVSFSPDGKMCLCVAADGTVRRWPVPAPFVEPDLARLADQLALMTGQRMDENQGLDSVPVDEWRALRAKLVGDGSTALAPPRPDADWHDAVAADAEQDHDALGAEWHLAWLAAHRPTDWIIPARRGRVLAAAGRKDEADAAYAAARRLAPSAQALSEWLRAAAADDEAAGRKEAAVSNLDRAVALTPADWALYVLRASVADPARAVADMDEAIRRGAEPGIIVRAAVQAAESGEWKRSAALFNSLAKKPTFLAQGHYVQAVANLKADDAAGYRAACAAVANKVPPVGPKLSPDEANNAAMTFALGPNATDDWTKPIAWLDHALEQAVVKEKSSQGKKDELRQNRHTILNTRGAVLFRAGRFAEAAKAIREGMGLHPEGGEFHDWLFLALAEDRLGHSEIAKDAATKARAAPRGPTFRSPFEKAEFELLAAELDAALPR